MTIDNVLWFATGGLLGGMHATLLMRAVRSGSGSLGAFRLLVVGGGLVLAAVFGGLLESALGWACGFGCLIIVFGFWRDGWNRSKSSTTR